MFDFLYGGNNEQAPDDQDGGAVEEQVGNANEQNADLGGNGGVNEQVPNEAVDIIEGLGNIDLNANIWISTIDENADIHSPLMLHLITIEFILYEY